MILITSIFTNAQLISANFNIDKTAGCETLNVNLQNVTLLNPDFVIWNFGDGNKDTITNPTYEQVTNYTYNEVGDYQISLTAVLDGDMNTQTQTVHVYSTPNVNFDYELAGYPGLLDTFYYSNQRYLFTAEQAQDSSHIWSVNGIEQVIKTDQLIFNFETSGEQTISHSVTINGCTASLDTNLTIIIEEVKVPNVFTPNNDGINDIFYITTDGQTSYKFTVLNRHGSRVYTSDSKIISWDGYSYWGEKLNYGTYYYTLESGKGDIIQGAILLVR